MEFLAKRLFGCQPQCCGQDTDDQELNGAITRRFSSFSQAGLQNDLLPEPQPMKRLTCGPGTQLDGRPNSVTSKDVKEMFRMAVGGGNDRDVVVQPPSIKSIEDMKLMVAAVKRNRNLQTVLTMEDKFCNAMIEMAWKEEVPQGTNVIVQGDLDGDFFYIVEEGTLEVHVNGVHVLNITKGGSFGELALLYYAPRAATVTAVTPAVLWVVDRTHFKAVLQRATEEHLLKFARNMHHMDAMEKLPRRVRLEVANALQEYHFTEGDVLYRFGEPYDSFWFCIEGELEIEKKGKVERAKGAADNPVILGEKAMSNDPGTRKETVAVASSRAVAVSIDRTTFHMIIDRVNREKDNAKRAQEGSSPIKNIAEYDTEEFNERRKEHIRLRDLQVKGVIGCGGFGLVELAVHKIDDRSFALKTISKGYVVKAGLQSNVLQEKNCQFLCDSPFVVALIDTFCTTQTCAFLQEAVLGGDLLTLYRREKFWGRADHTRFYCGGVVLAFEHMHNKKIIYRDLKPENVLVDSKGYPKVTDMGWAKVSAGKTYTLCGSLVSMAPEVIKCSGHNKGADWWALGVMMYELLSKETPFDAESPTAIYGKIFTGIDRADFSNTALKGDSEELIKTLCHPLPVERLPMKLSGVTKMKKHSWYKGFDWGALENLHLTAPFIPQVSGPGDMSNFRQDVPSEIPMLGVIADEEVRDVETQGSISRNKSYGPDAQELWDEAFATSC